MHTFSTVATEARALFTNADTRKSDDTGRNIWTVADHNACPEWVKGLCHDAHTDEDGGSMSPDDWRYELLVEALDILADADGDEDAARERADEAEAPVYNADRLRWLASHLWRASYCDEACEEFGSKESNTLDRIAYGYLYEFRRVFSVALEACTAEADERNDADPDEQDRQEHARAN